MHTDYDHNVMTVRYIPLGTRSALSLLIAFVLATAGCGGGGGGGGGGGSLPVVTLGNVTLTGVVSFPGTVDVLVDGSPALVTAGSWSYTTAQATGTHTYQVTMSEGGNLLAQRNVVVTR